MFSMTEGYVINRRNIFWIASFLGIILIAIYILVSMQITSYNAFDLGLLTKLPIIYWIGLLYLSALLYLGRKSKLRTIVVVVLISFYLFGLPTLITENKVDPISYYWSSQGEQIASQGRLDFSSLVPLDLRNWPAYFFLTTFLSSSTGLSGTFFASYFPLLTIALLGIITYSILRLRLSSLHSSLGALWVIGCLWTGQLYFMPQSIAYLEYFTIFLLVAKLSLTRKRGLETTLSILLLFSAIVFTHLLSSFFVLLGIIAVYVLYKIFFRKSNLFPFFSISSCFLLMSIFIAYQFFVIQRNTSIVIQLLSLQILQGSSTLSKVGLTASGSRMFGSVSYLLQVASSYTITILNIVIAGIAILAIVVGLLLHKKKVKLDLFWIAWVISAGLIGLTVVYGTEGLIRAFMFMLLPASYFAVKFLRKKRGLLILVLVMLVFLNISAQYGDRSYTYTPSTELKGASFFTKYAPSNESFFYEYLTPIGRNDTGTQLHLQSTQSFFYLPSSEMTLDTVMTAKLLVLSNMEKNLYQYFYGANLLENFSLVDNFSRVYDNNGFEIYVRQDE